MASIGDKLIFDKLICIRKIVFIGAICFSVVCDADTLNHPYIMSVMGLLTAPNRTTILNSSHEPTPTENTVLSGGAYLWETDSLLMPPNEFGSNQHEFSIWSVRAESLRLRLELLLQTQVAGGFSKLSAAGEMFPLVVFGTSMTVPVISSSIREIYYLLGLTENTDEATLNSMDREFWLRSFKSHRGPRGEEIMFDLIEEQDVGARTYRNTEVIREYIKQPIPTVPRLSRPDKFALLKTGAVMNSLRAQQLELIIQLLATSHLQRTKGVLNALAALAHGYFDMRDLNFIDPQVTRSIRLLGLVDQDDKFFPGDRAMYLATLRTHLHEGTILSSNKFLPSELKRIEDIPAVFVASGIVAAELSHATARCLSVFHFDKNLDRSL